MAISSIGIGSGIQLEDMITQLMALEKRPLQMLAAKEESYSTKLSAYSMVNSSLSTFQNAMKSLSSISKYQKTTASSTNEEIAKITAGATAINGTYSLKVNKLAQSQKLVAGGVASDKAPIGNGKITIDFGKITGGTYDEATGKYTGATFESNNKGVKTIDITDGNNTLSGIRDAINVAGIGVTASIVNDGSGTPYRLALTNTATGETQSMKITVEGADIDDGAGGTMPDPALGDLLAYDPASSTGQSLQQTVAAQNAEFELDGIKISKASNSVSDAIEGVTINLLSAVADKTTTLTVSKDTSEAKKAVEEMVKAYNDLNKTLKDLTGYNAEEKTASVLTGDSAIRSIQTSLKGVLQQPIAGGIQGYRMLSDVGITLNKEGVLEIDSSKLGVALEKNFDAFTGMFAEGGMSSNAAIQFEDAADYTKTGSFEVDITQVATKGNYKFDLNTTGPGLSMSATTDAQRTMQVSLNGVSKSITLSQKDYANEKELAAELQSKINSAFKDVDASVTVEFEAGDFKITSSFYGSESKISLTETGGLFDNGTSNDGLDVEGTINGQAAVGKGQTLTGAEGTEAYGLKLKVTGEDANIKGTVSFTQGYAYQFNKVANALVGENSAVSSRIDGLKKSIERVTKDYTNQETRLATVEARYRRQFTALDVLIAKLNSQSDYLTQQLSALSNMWGSSKK